MYNNIIISKANLINNIEQAKHSNPNSKICVMVKANAYGVGVREVVSVVDDYVDCYGVACFFEAKKLREITDKEILIVAPSDDYRDCVEYNIQISCHSIADARRIKALNLPIKVHIKINTGMNRYGISSIGEFKLVVRLLRSSRAQIVGVYTHFATDDEFVDEQMNRFLSVVKTTDAMLHVDNSAVSEARNHNLDMVRLGYNIYIQDLHGFKPVVRIKSTIVQIHRIKKGQMVGYNRRFVSDGKMRVAVIPIGYADGLDMRYIGGTIFFNGCNCKILNICMDCFMIDITEAGGVVGDEIFVIDKYNPIKKFAQMLNSSEYEVMTKFANMRADRIIVDY